MRAWSRGWIVAACVVVAGCVPARLDVPRPPSRAHVEPGATALGRAYAAQLEGAAGRSGIRLLVSGREAFMTRAALAEAAERTLDLQYYIVGMDATATLLLVRALQAAQRGVRVRLLIDDMYAVGRDFDLAALAAHPNVEVRVFNPFLRRGPFGLSRLLEFLADGARLNRRMHNKLWIADNAAAVVGGRNLGDAYFAVGGEDDFADLDVLAAGPVVAGVSRSFDDYWNSDWSVPIEAYSGQRVDAARLDEVLAEMASGAERFAETDYARALRATELGRLVRDGGLPLVPARATALYDDPEKPQSATGDAPGRIAPALRSTIEAAQHEVILVTPYFIPSERGLEVLRAMTARGVRVRVLTNSLASTDVPVVHAGYARYRGALLALGVQLHELHPGGARAGSVLPGLSSGASLHAKAVVVDREVVVVGSMNFDPRSRLSNTEVAVLIESAALGAELGRLFDEAVLPGQAFRVELTDPGNASAPLAWTGTEQGKPVRYDRDPLASWWQRFVASVLGALAPEELL